MAASLLFIILKNNIHQRRTTMMVRQRLRIMVFLLGIKFRKRINLPVVYKQSEPLFQC